VKDSPSSLNPRKSFRRSKHIRLGRGLTIRESPKPKNSLSQITAKDQLPEARRHNGLRSQRLRMNKASVIKIANRVEVNVSLKWKRVSGPPPVSSNSLDHARIHSSRRPDSTLSFLAVTSTIALQVIARSPGSETVIETRGRWPHQSIANSVPPRLHGIDVRRPEEVNGWETTTNAGLPNTRKARGTRIVGWCGWKMAGRCFLIL